MIPYHIHNVCTETLYVFNFIVCVTELGTFPYAYVHKNIFKYGVTVKDMCECVFQFCTFQCLLF